MLNMFCPAYYQKALQVDGASRRRFRIRGRNRRVKEGGVERVSVDIQAALWTSYESAAQYAEVTAFPHAKKRAAEARRRWEEYAGNRK
ncbi:hypothetical protein SAMN04488523_106279 [Sulfitobacter brevis]|uniref:Uncharacterized protein n=1 Tax=Sulfitobacter brevis TaxID=74348 RepID=A0A1I1ZWL1_9RHOB|nr:hypothetical protein SAMN04488523_106279 [Sulfitobacter brevis]